MPAKNEVACVFHSKKVSFHPKDQTKAIHYSRELDVNRANLVKVAVHPNGQLIGCGCADKCVILYDVHRQVWSEPAYFHSDGITSLHFVNHDTLLSCSSDGCVAVWKFSLPDDGSKRSRLVKPNEDLKTQLIQKDQVEEQTYLPNWARQYPTESCSQPTSRPPTRGKWMDRIEETGIGLFSEMDHGVVSIPFGEMTPRRYSFESSSVDLADTNTHSVPVNQEEPQGKDESRKGSSSFDHLKQKLLTLASSWGPKKTESDGHDEDIVEAIRQASFSSSKYFLRISLD